VDAAAKQAGDSKVPDLAHGFDNRFDESVYLFAERRERFPHCLYGRTIDPRPPLL
jgi:hypothetical protein